MGGKGRVVVKASLGSRPLTLDPLATHKATVEWREVETTIPCGFQVQWGTAALDDGREVELCCGAGFGSNWMTAKVDGKSYCVSAEEIIEALLIAIGAPEGTGV